MKNLFQKESFNEIIDRINKLSSETKCNWGKMTVDQMLAHCSASLSTATGEKFYPREFMGRIIGRFIKPYMLGRKPVPHNSPTSPHLKISATEGFEIEKKKLVDMITRFHEGGPEKCTKNPHSFIGRLEPEEWAVLMYTHTDHHLTQFGV